MVDFNSDHRKFNTFVSNERLIYSIMEETLTQSEPTVTKILDSAEGLFADRGFNATSMRSITNHAGVNLASVNYHFGSKRQLIIEVIRRGIEPINTARLHALKKLETESAPRPGLEEILDAFYRPAFEYFQDASKISFLRLLGRTLYETGDYTQELMEKDWMPLVETFLLAIQKALPEHQEEELIWSFHFAIGSMIFTVSQYEALEAMACESCKIRDDFEPSLQRLINFTAAGFRRPDQNA